jgi:hypothetical protein
MNLEASMKVIIQRHLSEAAAPWRLLKNFAEFPIPFPLEFIGYLLSAKRYNPTYQMGHLRSHLKKIPWL